MYDAMGRRHEYDLKASDVPNISANAKLDSEFLNQHPEFFVEYRVGDTVDGMGNKTPVTERKLNIDDTDLAVAYLNRLKDKRVVPLSEIPASPEAREAQSRYQDGGQQQGDGQEQSNAIVIPDDVRSKLKQLSSTAAQDSTQKTSITNAKEAYKILRNYMSPEKAQEIVKKDYSLK